ncbi:hypothetical protein VCR9J2_1110005 [Vibrio crassostreae]|nr:hypothetical protein VCR9J2_1110005 [Vibrio crassostreae]
MKSLQFKGKPLNIDVSAPLTHYQSDDTIKCFEINRPIAASCAIKPYPSQAHSSAKVLDSHLFDLVTPSFLFQKATLD